MNALTQTKSSDIIEAVIARGDIGQLNPEERARYYVRVCESVGLNPMTRPFEYITLNGKLVLYARKDCTDQLRTIHKVSVTDLMESERDGVFIVTAKVQNSAGRTDAAKGAVNINGLKGEVLANAIMKAETKAKRRATLSICGLGFLDETEIDDIPIHAGKGTTLPKKDARDIFSKLQEEIRVAPSHEALSSWGTNNAERIKALPDDWQHILRLRYEEMLIDLRNREASPPHDPHTGEVVWDEHEERPAKPEDFDGIPPELDRRPKKVPATSADVFDPAQWLRQLDGAFGSCEDFTSLGEQQSKLMTPHKGKVFPPDWQKAETIIKKHLARISTNTLNA